MRMLPLVLLFGCGPMSLGTDGTDTAGGNDTGGGNDTDTSGGDTEVSPDAPVIESVENVMCQPNTDSEPSWFIQATVTDPQGQDTFSKTGSYAQVIIGGIAGTEHYGVCNKGALTISWEDPSATEACEITGTVRIYAVDEDDNRSAPWNYDWPAK